MVFTASEFRQYAEECLASARTATSAERRKHFVDMAKLWATAAANIEGGAVSQITRIVSESGELPAPAPTPLAAGRPPTDDGSHAARSSGRSRRTPA
jgi:hypothetical protein